MRVAAGLYNRKHHPLASREQKRVNPEEYRRQLDQGSVCPVASREQKRVNPQKYYLPTARPRIGVLKMVREDYAGRTTATILTC